MAPGAQWDYVALIARVGKKKGGRQQLPKPNGISDACVVRAACPAAATAAGKQERTNSSRSCRQAKNRLELPKEMATVFFQLNCALGCSPAQTAAVTAQRESLRTVQQAEGKLQVQHKLWHDRYMKMKWEWLRLKDCRVNHRLFRGNICRKKISH